MIAAQVFLLVFAIGCATWAADKAADRVGDLPGLMFQVNFKHYSGYLDASAGNHLHYWLLEAQSNAAAAPLVLWLNGGPGCSSLGALLTEHGPFFPTADGVHLQENVYSWNKVANMLYLESPRQVGFSYRDSSAPEDNVYNDDKTASDTVLALKSFFRAFPEYTDREFYVAGQSYGGVYVPTLVDALIKELKMEESGIPMNLVGFAIGNGGLNDVDQLNSAINLNYFKGIIGKDEYDKLYECCASSLDGGQFMYCDFSQWYTLDGYGNAVANQYADKASSTHKQQECADSIICYGFDLVWNTTNNVYNTYQDCYVANSDDTADKMGRTSSSAQNLLSEYDEPFVDQGSLVNIDSTDSISGFPCYMEAATEKYLNNPAVRRALHISDTVGKWIDCNDDMNEIYLQQNNDTGPVFDSIINSGHPIRVLLFNGDIDMACNFMGDEWFIERLAKRNEIPVTADFRSWDYTRSRKMQPRGAGFTKRFSKEGVSIDMITVKGAGHYVSTDRPGPALQMFANFLNRADDYSKSMDQSLESAPLLPEYQPPPPKTVSRKEADRVYDLPGLSFETNYKQYAGYLSGGKGNHIHYWFFESQRSVEKDPLILWLTGGPGCSGYTALLIENGPFRPNRDGATLFENVFSWNKIANVIYVEAPHGVGFSTQNLTENPDLDYDDEKFAEEIYFVLKDFFNVYPEYVGRPFYITGESYSGVYIPAVSSFLVDKITDGEFPDINFKGVAIGNGLLSRKQQVSSLLQVLYFHGVYGKAEHDALMECCPKSDHSGDPEYFEFCDFSEYIRIDEMGNLEPRVYHDKCGILVTEYAEMIPISGTQDQYSLDLSCYEPNEAENSRPNLKKPIYADTSFIDQALLVSHEGSNSIDAFSCWMDKVNAEYLNHAEVQTALHVQKPTIWQACSAKVDINYNQDHNDTTVFFDNIISKNFPLHVLIYNGDVDPACDFIGAQWFVDNLASKHDLPLVQERKHWRYRSRVADYTQRYHKDDFIIDLLTVKGSGHFVPTDRAGPALQMLSALLDNDSSYEKPVDIGAAVPLKEAFATEEDIGQRDGGLPQHAAAKKTIIRAMRDLPDRPAPPPHTCDPEQDLVSTLPGLTFEFNSKHYSGYLNPRRGNYLHYWLVEHDTDPDNAPLILWLSGKPGCSSIAALMQEFGPFLNNNDGGETLYENVFSWHKARLLS